MTRPVHGGGVDRAARELGLQREQILDFSASINPLGLPDSVRRAVVAALERTVDYPEIDADSLRQELAEHHLLPAANLLPGSGSTELIYLLPRILRPRRVLLLTPAFSEYAPALRQVGCRIDELALRPEEGFRLVPQRLLEALTPETDLVWLANPGNPSGVGIEPNLLETLAEQLGDCRLLVDEAFVDFTPERSLLQRVVAHPNLLVLRSLTKFYAIPGIRVGYLAGPTDLIGRLAAAREPWTLSNLAIAAAKACLQDTAYRQQSLQEIPRLRRELAAGLSALGLPPFPGEANYLLLQLPDDWPASGSLYRQLYERGILIRDCADFVPLNQRFVRLAVRSSGENQQLLQTLSALQASADL